MVSSSTTYYTCEICTASLKDGYYAIDTGSKTRITLAKCDSCKINCCRFCLEKDGRCISCYNVDKKDDTIGRPYMEKYYCNGDEVSFEKDKCENAFTALVMDTKYEDNIWDFYDNKKWWKKSKNEKYFMLFEAVNYKYSAHARESYWNQQVLRYKTSKYWKKVLKNEKEKILKTVLSFKPEPDVDENVDEANVFYALRYWKNELNEAKKIVFVNITCREKKVEYDKGMKYTYRTYFDEDKDLVLDTMDPKKWVKVNDVIIKKETKYGECGHCLTTTKMSGDCDECKKDLCKNCLNDFDVGCEKPQ